MLRMIGCCILLICGLLFNTPILLSFISQLFSAIRPSQRHKLPKGHDVFSIIFCLIAFLTLEIGMIALLIECFKG